MSDLAFSREKLLETLLQVQGLSDRSARDARVEELNGMLAAPLRIRRSDDAAEDLAAILEAASTAPNGLRLFAETVIRWHPGDASARFGALAAGSRPSRPRVYRPEERIVGDIPIRNRNFTGRVELLERLGATLSKESTTSVLPPTLKGLGGVGKTQLVIEYVHRNLDRYDLIWWIPAEQSSTVLASLTQLAQRIDLPIADDQQETARTVLNWLAAGGDDRDWLLVYDNADEPSDLTPLLPSTGGHVIVTTRIEEWSHIGIPIEVDVFRRDESVQMLTRRTRDSSSLAPITDDEADELAEALGDLPLALEQAAAWYLATGMPVGEYIELLGERSELLNEGKPADYPLTVAAFVSVALEKLDNNDRAAAQFFALFAFLGGEPVRQSLLVRGANAALTAELRAALNDSISTGRMVRELRKYGLAKQVGRSTSAMAAGDRTPRLQVHRLVQRVLRDTLNPELRQETLRNVQRLLAVAKPGDPDEVGELALQSEMGPHLTPADMVHSGTPEGRQTVLDHARYLYIVGDYENSRALASRASEEWSKDETDPLLGPDGQSTLLARAQIANAIRALGDSSTASELLLDTYNRFLGSPLLGPEHPYTLITGNQRGHDMRIAGQYREAMAFDEESYRLHREVFGDEETYTLRVKGNLAVDYRLFGDFAQALKLDEEIVSHWADQGIVDANVIRTHMNVARDFYGLGHYNAALERLREWLPEQERLLGARHGFVLMSERTHAITLRKLGRLAEALEVMRTNHERTANRFNSPFNRSHEFSVAATVSLANVLRQAGELPEAAELADDALNRYRDDFGDDHPLTLAAEVNRAIIMRAAGLFEEAFALDQHAYPRLQVKLGPDHPYTICAGTSLANDHALAGRHGAALELSEEMLRLSREADAKGTAARGGQDHPYVLMRAINLSLDLRATGAEERGAALFRDSLDQLSGLLGASHPEVAAAAAGQRLEGDIEAPPT
ncbi:FxSxx-COOH system tetratricopeptide repeat protein [Actinoplanes hulinensis]|uniref:FxSxx-COOH system tetratricopeptide repeat protein n=1 Tax=Actinoplanes hulinensis TaxID=1144547 RepID=UPI0027E24A1A|nr:FxSxx-COOH system tetratricopeptide repeat protein [Actinoplanes hulinensis]